MEIWTTHGGTVSHTDSRVYRRFRRGGGGRQSHPRLTRESLISQW
jgi:hypothetical protein